MTTTTTTAEPSIAHRIAMKLRGRHPFIGPLSGTGVSGVNYGVSYHKDGSILCSLVDRVYRVLDDQRRYYREDVEHAMRCLGEFGIEGCRERLLKAYGPGLVWVSGVLWDADSGDWVDVQS